jgi:hypothetical protein
MQSTAFVSWMHRFSKMHPRDSFEWIDVGSAYSGGIFDFPNLMARLPDHSTWRALTYFGFSPFGVGIRTKKQIAFQSEIPEKTWAWDEISFITRSKTLGCNCIETNCFVIGFAFGASDEAPLRLLARISSMAAFSRYVSSQPPPLIESPISDGVLAAEGLMPFYRNGFPAFAQQSALDFARQILCPPSDNGGGSILMPDS